MSSESTDLQQFHAFVARQIASGVRLTPEDCIDLWRANHPLPADLVDSLAAIEEGLAQSQRGEGIPLEEFVRQFREEKGIQGADE